MTLQRLDGYNEAAQALRANWTPRYCELHELERYVQSTQYDDRSVDWLDNSTETPLWERRPSVAYPIVHAAISGNVDLILGEGRFPALSASVETDDDEDDPDGLDDDTRESVTKLASELAEQGKLKATAREALAQAMGCGSAVAIVGVRGGRVFTDTTRAKWCTPEFDAMGAVVRLEIRYPYLDRAKDKARNHWRVKARIYRRVIDADRDVTYLPADADKDGAEPAWREDPSRTFAHALGFCPVVWHAHIKGTTAVNDIDGNAIHARAMDEIRALDYALSQRHRCALLLEPQIVEIGVAPGYSPTETGRQPDQLALPGDPIDTTDPDNLGSLAKLQSYVTPGSGAATARKKGPGYPWQYASDKTKVEMLQLNPGALDALDNHCKDLKAKISESLATVFLDPENLKFASTLSGKALATLKQRQIDRCDQIRDDFGDGFLLPIVDMLLRVALAKRPRVRGLDSAAGSAEKFLAAGAELTLEWGDYFKPDPSENKAVVDAALAAHEGGLITRRLAVKDVAGIFGIEDIDAVLAKLDEEAEERAKKAQEMMSAAGAVAQPSGFGGGSESGQDDASGRGGAARPAPNGARNGQPPRAGMERR